MAKQAMKWIAPKDSQAHQVFISKAEEAGYPSSLVRDFFYQINAHPYLLCFVQISRNLIEILRLPCEQWSSHSGDVDFKAWRSLSRWVVEHADTLTEAIGPQFDERPRKAGDNPLLNRCVTRHPLYSALWNYQEKPELRSHYAALQAQALYAYSAAVCETYSLEAYESYAERDPLLASPKSASAMGQTVRELSHGFAEDELLVFDPFVPPRAFGKFISTDLHNLIPAGLTEDIRQIDREKQKRQEGLRYFSFFIQRAHGYKTWSGRGNHNREEGDGGSGGESGYVDFDQIAQGLDVKGEEGVPHKFVPSISGKRGKSISQALKWDDPPFDDEEGTYFYADPGDDQDDLGKKPGNPATSFLRARNQARHIAMANQYLPWRYQSLTVQEVHSVAMAAKSYLTREALVSGSSEQLGFFELALLILIVLWTGSSWEKAVALRVQQGGRQRSRADLCLISSSFQHQWRVKSTFPEYKTQLNEPKEVVRPRVEHVLLPDVGGIGDWVLRLMEARGQTPSPKSKVFRGSVRQHREAFKHLVEKAGESERVTWTNWERVLFDAIVAETGDVVDAVAITGEPHALAQTKSFYFTPREGDLVEVYLRTPRKLASQAELGVDTDFDRHLERATHMSNYVGSRACAAKPAVVDAVAQLKGELKSNRSYEGWPSFSRYHNLFTFYTVQMLAFSTGYRAVKTPFLTLEEVNGHLSVTVISDKDNERKHKSRLSYLPDVVWRQLEHYERHLEVLFATNDFRLKRGGEIEVEPCFLLPLSEDRAGTQEVRPRTLVPYLKDFLGLPANAHRRFLRTELKEAGCPADYVNAFMGHASYGEEPWCSYSSLSVKNYRAMMALYLEPILSELGFEPVASRLIAGGVGQ
ncbi:hypothetical protein [Marinobacter sp. M5B]|uniref:hypothetical protein n=1 Tax=Marinobacter sp. M5B TaxID=3141535 RepID=UPI0036D20CCE